MWDSGVYINMFFEWFKTPEYRQPYKGGKKEQEFIATFEEPTWLGKRLVLLRDELKLDMEQIYWYYNKALELGDHLVKQEYPCFAEEAFLASGNCIFDQEVIYLRIKKLQDYFKQNPITYGTMEFAWKDNDEASLIVNDSIKFREETLRHTRPPVAPSSSTAKRNPSRS